MKQQKILNIAGARPNFMKVAPIIAAMKRRGGEFLPLLVHTGQHYDLQMSDMFLQDLGLNKPDVYLGVGSGSHAAQTAVTMQRFEPVVLEEKPDWVVVVGDVNSTLACSLVCSKLGIRVAHVEAGLRSRDRSMPEEVNRVLTDHMADLLLTPSLDANENLRTEGISAERIRFVGNVMIDSLFTELERSSRSDIRERLGVKESHYGVLTLHRPSNVDDRERLGEILEAVCRIARDIPIIFPAHPRTRKQMEEFGFIQKLRPVRTVQVIDPLGYLDFLRLYSGARLVMTDSGGIQEETTALSIPCLTLRENTERPVTVELGTNRVVGTNQDRITSAVSEILNSKPDSYQSRIPPLWDGKTADRILDALLEFDTRTE